MKRVSVLLALVLVCGTTGCKAMVEHRMKKLPPDLKPLNPHTCPTDPDARYRHFKQGYKCQSAGTGSPICGPTPSRHAILHRQEMKAAIKAAKKAKKK